MRYGYCLGSCWACQMSPIERYYRVGLARAMFKDFLYGR